MALDWLKKRVNPDKYYENLLNKIVYSTYINNNIVTWYNGWEAQQYIEKGYQGNLMIYSIIRKICDKIKGADMYVYRETPDRKNRIKYKELKYSGDPVNHAISSTFKRKELAFDDNNDLAKLIKRPNKDQSWSEFLNTISGFYYLTGEAFIYGFGGPGDDSKNFGKFEELHVLPSHLVTIVAGDWREPVKGYKLLIGDQSIDIPISQVRHIKMWNPRWDTSGSQLRGQSPLMAGRNFIKKNDSALVAWVKSNENEGAKGIVSPNVNDPKLWPNPDQRQKLDDRIDERINGGANTNRVVASAMPLRYDAIGLSPVALAILEGMNYDDEKLCNLFGINPVLFKPNATHANLEQAKKDLVTDIVIPFLNMLEEELNQFLAAPYDNLVLDFDTTVYPELKPDLKLMKEVYNTWQITGNEFREMVGFDAGEDPLLETHLVPAGLIPSDDVMNPDMGSDGKDMDYSDYIGVKSLDSKAIGASKGCLMYYPEVSLYEWEKALKLLIPQDIVQEYEFDPHVTILYGFLDDDLNKSELTKFVIQYMANKEIKLSAKELGVFSNDEYDVVKITLMDSGTLTDLNRELRQRFPYENDFPVYSPHMTLAYVDKGKGKRFDGQSIDIENLGLYEYGLSNGKIIYSDSNKKHTRIL